MGAFKFETIAPENASGGGLSDIRSEILERERNSAYAKGFKDGVNVTKDALELENNRLMLSINETLSDLQITAEQASGTVMRSLGPLIETIISHLAPEVLRQKLIEAAEQTLTNIFDGLTQENVIVEAPPDLVEAAERICAQHGFELRIKENQKLHDLEIKLHWAGGFDHIDMLEMQQQLIAKLNNFVAFLDEDLNGRERESGT